jgi:hypothetical protein
VRRHFMALAAFLMEAEPPARKRCPAATFLSGV